MFSGRGAAVPGLLNTLRTIFSALSCILPIYATPPTAGILARSRSHVLQCRPGCPALFLNLEVFSSVNSCPRLQCVLRALIAAGLRDEQKPVGVFLFLGPTGVGKTYLAVSIADTLFGSDQNIIRIDMSEFMERHSIARLIGSPPGYIGHDEGGQLTGAVKRRL